MLLSSHWFWEGLWLFFRTDSVRRKTVTEQEFIPGGGNSHFPGHMYPSTIPLLCWCLKLWVLVVAPGKPQPSDKGGKKSRREQLILEPRHVLGPGRTHKGTTWPWLIKYSHNSFPSTLQATNPVALEWRLLQGSYGASRHTHFLNINNEYTAK